MGATRGIQNQEQSDHEWQERIPEGEHVADFRSMPKGFGEDAEGAGDEGPDEEGLSSAVGDDFDSIAGGPGAGEYCGDMERGGHW